MCAAVNYSKFLLLLLFSYTKFDLFITYFAYFTWVVKLIYNYAITFEWQTCDRCFFSLFSLLFLLLPFLCRLIWVKLHYTFPAKIFFDSKIFEIICTDRAANAPTMSNYCNQFIIQCMFKSCNFWQHFLKVKFCSLYLERTIKLRIVELKQKNM